MNSQQLYRMSLPWPRPAFHARQHDHRPYTLELYLWSDCDCAGSHIDDNAMKLIDEEIDPKHVQADAARITLTSTVGLQPDHVTAPTGSCKLYIMKVTAMRELPPLTSYSLCARCGHLFAVWMESVRR